VTTPLERESVPATATAESADAVPPLDLSFDGAFPVGQLSGAQVVRPVAPLPRGSRPNRTINDGPFSVGLDIKSGRQVASPAARATADQEATQTLTDKVEGVVKHSTFGITGTYRF
jgi:hypothetical protein